MTRPARKPLRRTAWGMLLGGLAVTALMLGTGAYVVNVMGVPAGPGQLATWPAGTDISVNRPLGPAPDSSEKYRGFCAVTREGGQPMRTPVDWGNRNRSYFAGPATITCEQPVKVLTGPAMTIAAITRGPLVAVPLFAVFLGILFFFPRFAYVWARLGNPLGGLVERIIFRNRNNRFI